MKNERKFIKKEEQKEKEEKKKKTCLSVRR